MLTTVCIFSAKFSLRYLRSFNTYFLMRPCTQGAVTHTASENQVGLDLYMVNVYRKQPMVNLNAGNKNRAYQNPKLLQNKYIYAYICMYSLVLNHDYYTYIRM